NVSGIIPASGLAVDWFKDLVGRAGEAGDEAFADVGEVTPGSRGLLFLPHLAGERFRLCRPDTRGAFIGLTARHTRKEMARAVVEALAFAVREILQTMAANDLEVADLRVTGGQARDAILNQIKADVTGVEVRVPAVIDAELVGGTAVAYTALGEYSNLVEASEALVRMDRSYTPRAEAKELYDELFDLYRASAAGLEGVFARLARITGITRRRDSACSSPRCSGSC
ncbi:unnamed protein product, partial [marine sediment metagenome]